MNRFIFWDWNGTLLDDAETGLLAMNAILQKYNKPLLRDLTDYRAHFGFPVQDYYARLGLGADIFPVVSHEWMAQYNRLESACPLREGAQALLSAFQAAGCHQIILSASKRENLLRQMARYPIAQYFDDVLGLDHIYATSKEGIGREYLLRHGIDGADCVLLGDTLHDAEVARALGMRCILLEGGHQNSDTLRTARCDVAADFAQAARLALEG